jgi:hypothetical protein
MCMTQIQPGQPVRRPYVRPRLVVYGAFQEMTLTASMSKNMNDAIQGMNNLKT